MTFQKTGPLSQAELFQLWLSVVDRQGYSAPLVSQPNSGIEFIEQSHAQMARVSLAVDRSFQSMYILPWSGQTAPPAGGAQLATVQLVVTRTGQGTISARVPLIFSPALFYAHAPIDSSIDGPVQVLSGRRYLGASLAVLGPGELGPLTLNAFSERAFAGYNLPQPGTITVLEQSGAGLSNDQASVVLTPSTNRLVLRPEPEVMGPDQIGQYVIFDAGANLRRVRRVIGYEPPLPGNGGTIVLAATGVLLITGTAGAFLPGETLLQTGSLARAAFLYSTGAQMVVEALTGTLVAGQTVTGTTSGATASVTAIDDAPALVAETHTAVWRVLDWVADLGVQVTNPASPSGGQTPMLDALGRERQIPRSPGEPDDLYRQRVSTPADVVSPNALIRAANRILAPLHSACLREVGQAKFPGLFFDGDPTSTDPAIAFAFDLDFSLRPQDRYKILLDYTEFRAFFLMQVPSLGISDFGTAFDAHPAGAFDAAPYNDFFDGYPVTESDQYRNIWNALNVARAGGVGFDLVKDDLPCS